MTRWIRISPSPTGSGPAPVPPNSSAVTAATGRRCWTKPSSAPPAAKGSTSTTTTSCAKQRIAERGLEERPWNIWRFEELLPILNRRAQQRVAQFAGKTPLIHAERLGAELGLSNLYLKDDSTNRPSPLLQGPGRGDGDRPPAGAGQGRGRLRLHRQRRHRRRGAGRPGRRRRLHLLPGQHGEGEGEGLPGDGRPGDPARRQLRRGQPRLPRAGAGHRDGVRQHHPAAVLRRGGEDDGLRGGRGAGLEGAGPLRDPGRRRHPLLARPQGPGRAGEGRPGRDREHEDQHRPGRAAARRSPPRSRGGGEIAAQTPETAAHSLAIGAPGDGNLVVDAVRRAAARRRPPPTRRSSARSTCSARPRASSPSRPAARRSPATARLARKGRSPPTRPSSR